MSEEEDDILREMQKSLKVLDMYEVDMDVKGLIEEVTKEVEEVLALS